MLLITIISLVLITFLEQRNNINYKNIENSKEILLIDNLSHISGSFEKNLINECVKNNYSLIVKKDAGVNYFKKLSGNYALIILRMHSTSKYNTTWLFTTEEYKPNKYYLEQIAGEIHGAKVDYNTGTYFVLNSYYITHYIKQNIKTDCVVLMGCSGLKSQDMAQAWTDVGAVSFAGWRGDISLNMTDAYTKDLIKSYFQYGLKEGILDKYPSMDNEGDILSLFVYRGNEN